MSSPIFRRLSPRFFPMAHRLSHGVFKGRFMLASPSAPVIVVEVKGARTGLTRTVPLAAVPRKDGAWLVVGSNFGRRTHPAWTSNLIANPQVEVFVGALRLSMRARLVSGAERERLWPELIWWFPVWQNYTHVTDREFRVFALEPEVGDA